MEKLLQLVKKIYPRKNLIDAVCSESKTKNCIELMSIFTPMEKVKIPKSCFTRTNTGEIVLYRGIRGDSSSLEKSVAAFSGKTKNEILEMYLGQSKRDLAINFSGLTQGCDPILHTTTKRNIAKTFIGENSGVLVEYHIPEDILRTEGMLGHIGEYEVDFFHSIDKKYIAKTTKLKSTFRLGGDLPEPPKEINIIL